MRHGISAQRCTSLKHAIIDAKLSPLKIGTHLGCTDSNINKFKIIGATEEELNRAKALLCVYCIGSRNDAPPRLLQAMSDVGNILKLDNGEFEQCVHVIVYQLVEPALITSGFKVVDTPWSNDPNHASGYSEACEGVTLLSGGMEADPFPAREESDAGVHKFSFAVQLSGDDDRGWLFQSVVDVDGNSFLCQLQQGTCVVHSQCISSSRLVAHESVTSATAHGTAVPESLLLVGQINAVPIATKQLHNDEHKRSIKEVQSHTEMIRNSRLFVSKQDFLIALLRAVGAKRFKNVHGHNQT